MQDTQLGAGVEPISGKLKPCYNFREPQAIIPDRNQIQPATMATAPLDIQLPDFRFEETFMRSLQGYADASRDRGTSAKHKRASLVANTAEEYTEKEGLPVLPAPITTATVIYAVLKDQVMMPLVQGLVWAGILIAWRPIRVGIIGYGLRAGEYVQRIFTRGYM